MFVFMAMQFSLLAAQSCPVFHPSSLVSILVDCNICCGHPDPAFVNMAKVRKGSFQSPNKNVVARLDTGFTVSLKGVTSSCTVRHANCELLVADSQAQCRCCKMYRDNLRAMHASFSNKSKRPWNRHSNTRYLRSPQKAMKARAVKRALESKRRQLQRLKRRLDTITETHATLVGEHFRTDFEQIIQNHSPEIAKLPLSDFRRVFWEQQVFITSYT